MVCWGRTQKTPLDNTSHRHDWCSSVCRTSASCIWIQTSMHVVAHPTIIYHLQRLDLCGVYIGLWNDGTETVRRRILTSFIFTWKFSHCIPSLGQCRTIITVVAKSCVHHIRLYFLLCFQILSTQQTSRAWIELDLNAPEFIRLVNTSSTLHRKKKITNEHVSNFKRYNFVYLINVATERGHK